MFRKMVIALATTAALALTVAPTGASARAGHVGVGHPGFGHVGRPGSGRFGFHRFGFRRGPFVGGPWYGTCWRWVPGPYGLHRVFVCGPYAYAW